MRVKEVRSKEEKECKITKNEGLCARYEGRRRLGCREEDEVRCRKDKEIR